MFVVSYELHQQAGPRSAGWSMNFHNQAGLIDTVASAAQVLGEAIKGIVGSDTILVTASIRQVYPVGTRGPRLSTTIYFVKPGVVSKIAAIPDSDYPTNSLLVELKAASGETVRQTIRALWDDTVVQGGWYSPQGNYAPNLAAFFKVLSGNGGWCLYTQDQTNTFWKITNFDQTTGFLSIPGHPFVASDVIKVEGRKIGLEPRLNGTYHLIAVTAGVGVILLEYPRQEENGIGNFRSAFAQKLAFSPKGIVYDPTKAISSQPGFISERKVGRPRRALRGRRTIPR